MQVDHKSIDGNNTHVHIELFLQEVPLTVLMRGKNFSTPWDSCKPQIAI